MVRDHLDYRIPIDFGEPCRADRADEVVYRPVGENESRAHRVACGQDVHATLEALLTRTQRLEHADVLIRQRCELQQLRHERVPSPLVMGCHVALPFGTRDGAGAEHAIAWYCMAIDYFE